MRKSLLCFYILLMSAIIFTGCGGNNKVTILQYDLPKAISSIDPQFATDIGQRTIIYNVFDGLMCYDTDGSLVTDAAESYTVSSDGLTYRFTLKEGLKWSDGSSITSKDYAFGLKRLFNRQSPSPYSDEFLSIKNAEAVLAGQAELSALGINTPDDRTLVIELDKPSPHFLALMAHTASMPCNERFFTEQKGRYATGVISTLFNGDLLPDKWNSTSINLRPNPNHNPLASTPGVNIYFGRGEASELFVKEKTDLYMLDFHQIDLASGYTYQEYFNTNWSLVVNPKSEGLNDLVIRQAILSVIDSKELSSQISAPLVSTSRFVPPDTMLPGESYGKLATPPLAPSPVGNPMEALYGRLKELGLNKMPRVNIVVPDLAPCPEIGSMVQRQLLDKLSVYANLEIIPYDEISSKYSTGAYQIILYPVSPTAISAEAYLRPFTGSGDATATELEQLIFHSLLSSSASGAASYIKSAEQLLLDDYRALPLFLSPSRLVQQNGVNGVVYHPSISILDFSKASKLS